MDSRIITLSINQKEKLEEFLLQAFFIQEHLDWLDLDAIINEGYCYLLIEKEEAVAALGFTENSPGVFWIQFFYTKNPYKKIRKRWNILYSYAKSHFLFYQPLIASLPTSKIFEEILNSNGYCFFEEFLQLECHLLKANMNPSETNDITIRNMYMDDINSVTILCEKAFSPLWRLTKKNLINAYKQSDYAIVAENNEKTIIGYLLGVTEDHSAHLSRIAVDPFIQNSGLGFLLLNHFIKHYQELGIADFSVNTPSRNLAAIALYKKAGFFITGESIPVYVLNIR